MQALLISFYSRKSSSSIRLSGVRMLFTFQVRMRPGLAIKVFEKNNSDLLCNDGGDAVDV